MGPRRAARVGGGRGGWAATQHISVVVAEGSPLPAHARPRPPHFSLPLCLVRHRALVVDRERLPVLQDGLLAGILAVAVEAEGALLCCVLLFGGGSVWSQSLDCEAVAATEGKKTAPARVARAQTPP